MTEYSAFAEAIARLVDLWADQQAREGRGELKVSGFSSSTDSRGEISTLRIELSAKPDFDVRLCAPWFQLDQGAEE